MIKKLRNKLILCYLPLLAVVSIALFIFLQSSLYSPIIKLGFTCFVIFLSSTCLIVFTNKLTRPLSDLRKALAHLGDENFKAELVVSAEDEIGEIAHSFNRMKKQILLRNEEISRALWELKLSKMLIEHQNEKLSDMNKMFEKFVPQQFLKRIAHEGIETIELGRASSDTISILFADIRSFTELSEQMNPQELLNFLNSFLTRMNAPIVKNRGFVDKFIGDAIMALFDHQGTTVVEEAKNAVKAAIGMQEALEHYNEQVLNQRLIHISIGIGIHTGSVIVGTIGTVDRMDSTVLGDGVNLASRMEGLTKQYEAQIIISGETYDLVKKDPSILCRQLDFVSVKGKDRPTRIYEVFNANPVGIRDKKEKILPLYNKALKLYYAKEWNVALELFVDCLAVYPQDVVSRMFVERCFALIEKPPSHSWTGGIRLTHK